MNRWIRTLLAAALLLFVIAGCGKNAGTETNTATGGSGSAGGSATTGGSTGGSSSGSNSGSSGGSSAGSQTPNPGGSQAGGGSSAPSGPVSVGPLNLGESAQVGPLTVTVRKVDIVAEAQGMPPGYVYALPEIEVKNGGDKAYTINTTEHFRMETPEGKKAPYNMQAAGHRDPKLSGTVDPGQSSSGFMAHLAKKVDGTYKYQFVHPDYGDATWEFGL